MRGGHLCHKAFVKKGLVGIMDNRFRTRAYLEEYKMLVDVAHTYHDDGTIAAHLVEDDGAPTEFCPANTSQWLAPAYPQRKAIAGTSRRIC